MLIVCQSAPEKIFHFSFSPSASLKPRQIHTLCLMKFRNDNLVARSLNQECMIYSEAMRIFIQIYHRGVHELILLQTSVWGFPVGSESKEFARDAGDQGSVAGQARFSGEVNHNPLQYSCLENSIDGVGKLQSMVSQSVGHDYQAKGNFEGF